MSSSVFSYDNASKCINTISEPTAMQTNKCTLDWSACVDDNQPTAEMSHLHHDQQIAEIYRLHGEQLAEEMSYSHGEQITKEMNYLHGKQSTEEMNYSHREQQSTEEMNYSHREQQSTEEMNHSHREQQSTEEMNHLHREQQSTEEMNHSHGKQLAEEMNQLHREQLTKDMNRLHVSPLNRYPEPDQSQTYDTQKHVYELPIPWHSRHNSFATIAISGDLLVVVSNNIWFMYSRKPNWVRRVLYTLECVGITELFCCGYYVEVKRAANDFMNVYLDSPERHTLRYPCNICKLDTCIVQIAYLYWRKIMRRKPCNLQHHYIKKFNN